MTRPTFDDLTPPDDLVRQWREAAAEDYRIKLLDIATYAARWGAQQAAEQLAGQWPEPITDRPPTEADGDDQARVQILTPNGRWDSLRWDEAGRYSWAHSPRWQPPAPPTFKEQALGVLAGLEKRFDLQCDLSLIRRALEQASEAQP